MLSYSLGLAFYTSVALALRVDPVDTKSPLGRDVSNAPSYRSHLIDLHRDLVSIKSTSGLEEDVGAFLTDYFLEKGWMSTLQVVPPRDNTPSGSDRMNVVAWPDSDKSPTPKVLLTSHIDTVPPHIPYDIEDGEITKQTRISGRGSVDAKASVASMIVALEQLIEAEDVQSDDVMLLFVVGEEVSGDGMRFFNTSLDDMDPKPEFEAVIFGEPTENKLACGHKGALFCSLDVQGIGGHSGYPWLGKSATELLVRAMKEVLDADLGSSKEYGNTTVNLGRLEGGVAENVIPEHAHAGLMIRVALGPKETGGKVVQERIQAILDGIDQEAFDLVCSQSYGFVEAECAVDGFESIVVNYGTDMPNLDGDFTRYLYGPGTIFVAHGPHENVTVGDLESAVEGYQRLVMHALHGDSGDSALSLDEL